MRFVLFVLMLIAFSKPLFAASCLHSKKVLITAFEPFGGHDLNGSALVAESLIRQNSDQSCVQYEYCVLPVEYEKGSKRAIECLQRLESKPDLVISMGEGSCEIGVETMAHNIDDTPGFADNAGKIITGTVIDTKASSNELLTLPVADMFCASRISLVQEKDTPIVASISPGKYVCNDVAYRFGRYLKPKQIPFGFIHVPPVFCGKDARETAEKLNIMAVTALRSLQVRTSVFSKTTDEVIPAIGQPITAGCRAQVMSDLRKMSERSRRYQR